MPRRYTSWRRRCRRGSASAYVGTPLDATYGASAFYGIYLTVRSGDTMVRAGDPASVVGCSPLSPSPMR